MKTVKHHRTSKYRYVLDEHVTIFTGIAGKTARVTAHPDITLASIGKLGYLNLHPGFAWNGPGWPAIHTETLINASLFHDALQQLLRLMKPSRGDTKTADRLPQSVALDCGMWKLRAKWVYWAARIFGEK